MSDLSPRLEDLTPGKKKEEQVARVDTKADSIDSPTASKNEVAPAPAHTQAAIGALATADNLLYVLADWQRTFQAEAYANSMTAGNYRSGSGGWWEMSGYASILGDAIKRIRIHRKRTEGIDRQIERAAIAKVEGK